jgi:putative transcriptional regulator
MDVQIEPGLVLVAGVAVSDGVFDGTVCVILDGDDGGALGVVLNRLSDYELDAVLPGWASPATFPARLFDGGPVSQEGAICLAAPAQEGEEPPGWRQLFAGVGLLHLDTPLEIVQGAYRDVRVFAGYAGWGPGQLQRELQDGLWYPVEFRYADVFDADPATLWRRILRRQRGELALLSSWTPTPELN